MDITNIPFPDDQYIPIPHKKNQIVLHHTVSSASAKAVANWWASDSRKVATPYIIGLNGKIYQLFPENMYAGHVGDTQRDTKLLKLPARNCSRNSIGIEIVSMGPLNKKGNSYVNAYGKIYKPKKLIHYENGFRGYEYFEAYNDRQVGTVIDLVKYLCDKYDIPSGFDVDRYWNVSEDALKGTPGIYSHVSYRSDKSDIHPQENLLNELSKI